MSIDMKAVSVLPEPVGEETRTLCLAWMIGTAMAWASVTAPNLALNHPATTGCISPRTPSVLSLSVTLSIMPVRPSIHLRYQVRVLIRY